MRAHCDVKLEGDTLNIRLIEEEFMKGIWETGA
jgi:hypothetical protein